MLLGVGVRIFALLCLDGFLSRLDFLGLGVFAGVCDVEFCRLAGWDEDFAW
jgi:hypothetical protein